MEEKIIAKCVFITDERFPVFCHFGGQSEPQKAYISLDIETGEIDAGYHVGIGVGSPIRVLNDIELRFEINPYTHKDQIKEIIYDHMDQFQLILDGSEVVWKNCNEIGKFNDSAQRIIDKFSCETFLYTYVDIVTYTDLSCFQDEIWSVNDSQTITQLAKDVYDDGNSYGYWIDELNSEYDIEQAILEEWLNCLYSHFDLPKNVARLLLNNDDIFLDKDWLDTLKEIIAE